MNKNRNKIAAMMMVAAITVSSVAMPVEAAVSRVDNVGIEIEKKEIYNNKIEINDSNFKDENFRNYILERIDLDQDGYLSEKELSIENMRIDSKEIFSLEGIEYFKNLKYLDCAYNRIKDLDLTENIILESLICSNNNISSLKIPESLTELNCSYNKIENLNLSNKNNLNNIDCSSNEIRILDTNNLGNVEILNCSYNEIEVLNTNDLKNIRALYCNSNNIKNLDLQNNTKLLTLMCIGDTEDKKLTSLNLPSSIVKLDCGHNEIKELDVANCKNLETLRFYNNNISEINISECKKLSDLMCDTNNIKNLDLSNCKDLTFLTCSENQIRELDLSGYEKLETVGCQNNGLVNLNVKGCTKLDWLDCNGNNLTTLNLMDNRLLTKLECYNNKINNLNITNNESITLLNAKNNRINTIDLTQNKLLGSLNLENNLISDVDLRDNKKLGTLYLGNNRIKNINLENNTELTNLYLENNELEKINLFNNVNLISLDLSNNNLREVNLENSKGLKYLYIKNNRLPKLEINNNFDNDSFDANNQNIKIRVKSSDKSIDLRDLGITEYEVNKNKIKLNRDENIELKGNKIIWKGKIPKLIIYYYRTGKDNSLEMKVKLELVIDNGNDIIDQNEKPNKKHEKIIGSDRYETAAKIADKMGSYNTVILVNSDKSMADGLSAASLSGKKNAPILLVKQDKIPKATMDRINKASNVYIIGGENAISKNVEKQLKESGKKINRISGKDRYDTSKKIAELLGVYDKAFIVNGAKGEADAMSVSAVAAKYGAPILLTNGKTSIHDKKSGVKYYAIGGTAVIDNKLEEKYSAERMAGSDRYDTNSSVIDKFYRKSEKVYFAKGDTLIDALTASALAKDNGIVLVSKNRNHSELDGKDTVQVGGMNFEIDFE